MANTEKGSELSRNPSFRSPVATDLVHSPLDGELQVLQKDIKEHFPGIHHVLQRNEWGYALINLLNVMPEHLQGSLRVGEITHRVVRSYSEKNPHKTITQKDTDGIVLGALFSDIGKTEDDPEKMHEVYGSGIRWRDDPEAWQWQYVKAHTGNSSRLVLEAGRDPKSLEVLIPRYHHGLKKENPYTAEGAVPIGELDALVQFGIQVAAAADVSDAVTKDRNGVGRDYLKDEEFANRDWVSVVRDEITVDADIAELAVYHTMELKGMLTDESLPLSA